MNTFEALTGRYSYRGIYQNAPVPREDLERIMQAGLDAPSGCNTQTTSLIAVDDPEVLKLRYRMVKNAAATLLCSRGTPMFFAGDEFCNTSFGNNNPYCQDNIVSWLDWNNLKKHKDIFEFFKKMPRLMLIAMINKNKTNAIENKASLCTP